MHISKELKNPVIDCVLILNFNTAELIGKLLPNIVSEAHRVVIRDNNSDIEDKDLLRLISAKYANVEIFFGSENLGFGGGHNWLMTNADIENDAIVWILNPDVTVDKQVPAMLVHVLVNSQYAIVSPAISKTDHHGSRLWFSGGIIDLRKGTATGSQLGKDLASISTLDSPLKTEFMTGTAPMMRRRTFDRIGGFRDDLFLYWEDVEFSLRARDLGVEMAVIPWALIDHLEGGSARANRHAKAQIHYYIARNRVLVCANSLPEAINLMVGTGLPETLRMSLRAFLRGRPGRLWRTWNVIRGTLNGASRFNRVALNYLPRTRHASESVIAG